jgi:hypothetical protein
MNEFEKESATMDMKEEMMSDAVDDVMDDEAEGEGEEEEGDKVLREVLDEIGVSMGQMVSGVVKACQMIDADCLSWLSLGKLRTTLYPHQQRYQTSKPSPRAWAPIQAHPAPDLVNHQRAVVPESEVVLACLTRMHCKLVWISFEGIERDYGMRGPLLGFSWLYLMYM